MNFGRREKKDDSDSSSDEDKESDTMEGMIKVANEVLDNAFKPDNRDELPAGHFRDRPLYGLVIVRVESIGVLVASTYSGNGIVLGRNPETGKWSAPCACCLEGVGYGMMVGASDKDMIIFLYGKDSLETIFSTEGLKVGAGSELTVGNWSMNGNMNLNVTKKGVSLPSTLVVSFSKGVMFGSTIEGSALFAVKKANTAFYGQEVKPNDIVNGNVSVSMEKMKSTGLTNVYEKLILLSNEVDDAKTNDARNEGAFSAIGAVAEVLLFSII